MLDHSDHPEAAHHGYADQLQADVQPLPRGVAQEQAALVELQAPGDLVLKPGTEGTSPSVSGEPRVITCPSCFPPPHLAELPLARMVASPVSVSEKCE